jgi:alpha-mannosidase
VSHALGAASWQPGWLEMMLDRRTLYDDSRGMGEGVVDNKRTVSRFWLLLEELSSDSPEDSYSRPSLYAHHLSNSLLYPANLFVIEGSDPPLRNKVSLLSRPLPCDTHLLTLRTLADPLYSQFPATSALMVLHKQGFSCRAGADTARLPQCALGPHDGEALHPGTRFNEVVLGTASVTSLTGMHHLQSLHSLDDVRIPPMQLLTLNLTFVL